MSKTHIIENGVVIATIMATVSEAQAAFPDKTCIDGSVGAIGWEWDGENLTPPVEPDPTPEEIYAVMEYAVDQYIDSVAQAKGYDNRITATMRAGYVNPWQAEGIAFGQWMDSCYSYCQQVQADVLAATRTVPTIAELIAELPAMVWPE